MATSGLNRNRQAVYRTALKDRENLPTVNWLPRLLRYRPTMSSPPPLAPQVRTRPLPTPARMPPSRQAVR